MEAVEPKGSCASLQRTDLGGENDLHDPRQRFSSVMSDFFFFSFLTIVRMKLWTKLPREQLAISRDHSGRLGKGCADGDPPALIEARELGSSEVPQK